MPSTPTIPPHLPHVPRPTILLIMVWTALTAVALVMLTRGLGFADTDPLSVGLLTLAATAVGWIYMGGLLILRHVLSRTLWILEPGEWLVLMAVNLLTLLAIWGIAAQHFHHWPYWFAWLMWLLPAEFALAFVVAATSQHERRIWSALFWTLAVASLSFYLLVWLGKWILPQSLRWLKTLLLLGCSLSVGYSVVALSLLTAGIVSDGRQRRARHWLHWSAVVLGGLVLIGVAGTAIFAIVMLLR